MNFSRTTLNLDGVTIEVPPFIEIVMEERDGEPWNAGSEYGTMPNGSW